MQWLRTKAQLCQKMLCSLECLHRTGKPFLLGCFQGHIRWPHGMAEARILFLFFQRVKGLNQALVQVLKSQGVCSFSNLNLRGFQGPLVSSTHFKNNKEKPLALSIQAALVSSTLCHSFSFILLVFIKWGWLMCYCDALFSEMWPTEAASTPVPWMFNIKKECSGRQW